MILTGRHYVTLGKERFRSHHVVRTEAHATRAGVKMRYLTVSRHWTWKGANKAARRLNTKDGIA